MVLKFGDLRNLRILRPVGGCEFRRKIERLSLRLGEGYRKRLALILRGLQLVRKLRAFRLRRGDRLLRGLQLRGELIAPGLLRGNLGVLRLPDCDEFGL